MEQIAQHRALHAMSHSRTLRMQSVHGDDATCAIFCLLPQTVVLCWIFIARRQQMNFYGTSERGRKEK